MKINIEEALRYVGVKGGGNCEDQAAAAALKLEKGLSPKYIWKAFDIRTDHAEKKITLADIGSGSVITELSGNTAFKMLSECEKAAVLVCTLGFGFEKLLALEQARSMADAVILDACGSAYVEAGCDEAEKEIASYFPGKFLSDRFSPGYGDLTLDIQEVLLNITGAGKQLGIYLTDSMLMNPTKTVTAFVGISQNPQRARIRGCKYCAFNDNCNFRKAGTTCER